MNMLRTRELALYDPIDIFTLALRFLQCTTYVDVGYIRLPILHEIQPTDHLITRVENKNYWLLQDSACGAGIAMKHFAQQAYIIFIKMIGGNSKYVTIWTR